MRRSAAKTAFRPTLAEVARLAKVSPATVSRALNNPNIVAEETNRRIQEAVRQTGYVPNLLAGGLASSRSRLVAIIVPVLARSVFNEMIEAMTEELMAARYQVMLSLSGHQDEHLPAIVDSVLARRPEGIILTGMVTDPLLRERLVSTGATIIETRHLPGEPIQHVIGFSHHAVGVAVAQAFHELGRRMPLIVAPDTVRSLERQNGFTKEMARLGVRRVSTITMPMPSSVGQGRAALAEFLDNGGKADCVMCGADWQAHGVIIEAQRRGIRIPEDLAVFGFGNTDFAESMEPSLSSVNIDGRQIGVAAAQILVERSPGPPTFRDVGFSLIRRESA
ncbi:MAG: LacI family DNA-binding transcriptional regulator [Hyphomonadaceae bacterium]|nr:LacI family DNA-binding transcriptional regulator [Hyphomonadaceae bacterium]